MNVKENINLLKDAIKQNTIRMINKKENEIAENIDKYCKNRLKKSCDTFKKKDVKYKLCKLCK